MRATLKVKHLVLLLVAMTGLLLLIQLVVIPRTQEALAVKHFRNGESDGKELLMKEMDRASGSAKWKLIRDNMIQNGTDLELTRFEIIIGPDSTTSNFATSLPKAPDWTSQEKVRYLTPYTKEGPVDGYLARAGKQLAFAYLTMGRQDDALTALEQVEKRLIDGKSDGSRELKLDRAKIYVWNERYAEAEKLLAELSKSLDPGYPDFNGNIVRLQTRIFLEQGQLKQAYDRVVAEVDAFNKVAEEEVEKFPEFKGMKSSSQEQMVSLKNSLENALKMSMDSTASVSGVVKHSDGSPMAGIGVYLRNRNDVYHSLVEGEPYQTLSDSQGRYVFKGVIPGSYQVYVGLQLKQIDGWTWPVMYNEWIDVSGGQVLTQNVTLQKLIDIHSPVNDQVITGQTVKFEWEPVDGAAYYALLGTFPIEHGTVGHQIRTHIVGTGIELPLEELYNVYSGFSHKKVGDRMIPDPSNLLGYADSNSRFSWSVEAYDAQGELITRSFGYRLNEKTMGNLPFFYLKSRTLTGADQLLLKGEVEQALDAYKQDYKADQDDIHSLRMIIRLYNGLASVQNKPEYEDEAIPYIEQMVSKDASSNYLFNLLNYQIKHKNWEQADHYFGLLEKARQGKVESYDRSIYASGLMKQRRMEEANAQFAIALADDDSHRFVGNAVATELYLTGKFESALRTADRYPEREYNEKAPPDWATLVRGLEQESRSQADGGYFVQLRTALDFSFDGDQVKIDEWMASAKLPAMKAFLQALTTVD